MSTTCTECGSPIDTTADTPDTRVPCPNCGGERRTVQLSATGMRPSNYMLDNHVAHKLSHLTECGAQELTASANWLNNFILTDVFIAGGLPAETRAYIFNFLRRAEGASSAYRQGRSALIEYLETPPHVLSPYFRALLNFEVCISQCYQGYELLARASGQKCFERNDKSELERLCSLYISPLPSNGQDK
jgi:DNA-directed RNA polymerase subunit RPC12/RpoP